MTAEDIKSKVQRQGILSPLTIIASKGDGGFVSSTIRGFSKSEYSHIDIVYLSHLTDGLPVHIIVGAMPNGVVLNTMKRYWRTGTDFDVFVCPGIIPAQRTTGTKFLEDALYTPYDYRGLFSFLRIPFLHQNKKRFFCSELAAEMFKKIGVLSKEYASSECKPGDVAAFPFLEKVTK